MSTHRPTRRRVLGGAAALSASIAAAPFVRARPLRDRLKLAAVGAANRGAANIAGVLSHDVAALCDVDAGLLSRGVAQVEKAGQKRPKTYIDWRELLDEENPIQDGDSDLAPADMRGGLELRGVSFTYDRGTAPALRDVSVSVEPGQTLGIVGPTGAGKSTLLNLVGRLFQAESGAILLAGTPLADLRLSTLRGTLGYVPQDSFLFSERYDDNIRFGADGELTDGEVDALIERVAMKDEVAEFPDGSATVVGERGVSLSGGQRQRTCIARALARDPKILVLDDCLSAVDTETERELLGSLRTAGEGRTVLVSAHRLSTVKEADRIVVLTADGAVEATGTHAELLERPGWYAETWEQQQRTESLAAAVESKISTEMGGAA